MPVHLLTKFRDDGKSVPDTMSSTEMLELGWGSSIVRKVSWIANETEYNYSSAYSLSACIVRGNEYIAIVESTDEHHRSSLLRLISADGRSHLTASNTQEISGRSITGQFEWFDLSASSAEHTLAIVFRPAEGSDAYRLYVDAATGNTISAEYIRA